MSYLLAMLRCVLLCLLIQMVVSQRTTNITLLKQLYETSLNSSIHLDREDRVLQNSWAVEFQVKRVELATRYRMQVARHKEHNFRWTQDNAKWTECMFLHRKQIRKAEKQYYADESQCLATVADADKEQTKTVEQVEKESRKWRKSYRYLVHTCSLEQPDNEEAANMCLVQYMEKDKYSEVIKRLIILKLEAMGQLFIQLNNSVKDLDECLKTQLSSYLDKVRDIMDTLYKCYSVTTQTTERNDTE